VSEPCSPNVDNAAARSDHSFEWLSDRTRRTPLAIQICRFALADASRIGHSVFVDDERRGRRGPGFAEAAQPAEQVATRLIGMDEADAVSTIEEAGLAVRIAQRDGARSALRSDKRPSRINLTIKSGKVSAAEVF
jgi:hypothetical protein